MSVDSGGPGRPAGLRYERPPPPLLPLLIPPLLPLLLDKFALLINQIDFFVKAPIMASGSTLHQIQSPAHRQSGRPLARPAARATPCGVSPA